MGAIASSSAVTDVMVCPRRRRWVGAPVPVTTISSRFRATSWSSKFTSLVWSTVTVTSMVAAAKPMRSTRTVCVPALMPSSM